VRACPIAGRRTTRWAPSLAAAPGGDQRQGAQAQGSAIDAACGSCGVGLRKTQSEDAGDLLPVVPGLNNSTAKESSGTFPTCLAEARWNVPPLSLLHAVISKRIQGVGQDSNPDNSVSGLNPDPRLQRVPATRAKPPVRCGLILGKRANSPFREASVTAIASRSDNWPCVTRTFA